MSLEALNAGIQLAQAQMEGAKGQKESSEESRRAISEVGNRVAQNKDETARQAIQAKYDMQLSQSEVEYAQKKHQRAQMAKTIGFLAAGADTALGIGSGLYKAFSENDKLNVPKDQIAKWDSSKDSFQMDPSQTARQALEGGGYQCMAGGKVGNDTVTYSWTQDKDGNIGGVSASKNGGPAHALRGPEVDNFRKDVLPELGRINIATTTAGTTTQPTSIELGSNVPLINVTNAEKWLETKGNVVAPEKGTLEGAWDFTKKVGAAVIVEGIGGSIPLWKQAVELMDKERDALDNLEKAKQKRAAALTKLRALTESMENATSAAGAAG